MTDDIISRKAASEAMRCLQTYKLCEGDEMLLVDVADVLKELRELPSAQGYADTAYLEKMSELTFDTAFEMGKASAHQWIPIKMRPMDSEEREYWEEHAGFALTDDFAQTFDCPMPDDGQRIWVQTKNGFVFDDVCDSDCDGIGLEGNGDWDDIVAWMPMLVPEPWKGEENG